MRILYLDCSMGAAGDMLMAALYELLEDKQAFLDMMRSLGLPGIEISAEPAVKCGITGTHMKVLVHGSEELDSFHEHLHGCEHDHAREPDHAHTHAGEHEHHQHTGLHEIEHLLSHLDLPQTVRQVQMREQVLDLASGPAANGAGRRAGGLSSDR